MSFQHRIFQHTLVLTLCVLAVCSGDRTAIAADEPFVSYRLERDEIREPLTRQAGDAVRGKDVVVNRDAGHCLLCHVVPQSGSRFMGDIGPTLAGVGNRFGIGQLRLRLVDASRMNPQTIMPSYYRIDGLQRVASAYRGKTVLTAQQIEDAVAYLATLRE